MESPKWKKMAFLELPDSSKLISCKIRITKRHWDFHTVQILREINYPKIEFKIQHFVKKLQIGEFEPVVRKFKSHLGRIKTRLKFYVKLNSNTFGHSKTVHLTILQCSTVDKNDIFLPFSDHSNWFHVKVV